MEKSVEGVLIRFAVFVEKKWGFHFFGISIFYKSSTKALDFA